MALLAVRNTSCSDSKFSKERNTGLPLRTIRGPPPSPSCTFVHGGVSVRTTVTFDPTGASPVTNPACEPRATRTAPSAGIGWLPPGRYPVTVAVSALFGAEAGKGCRTAYAPPLSAGVRAPQEGVYS